ncbi:hypothetical protein ST47_g2407 [Ascochyta rabiei]|uniref:Uncharacterized protein n=2 Tax=Didymella rabiei TaxID=5454 RepID=A0A163JPX3_DIDRA|nr:hypothetical protein ST47_g2407 [Ascochyta rabiei]
MDWVREGIRNVENTCKQKLRLHQQAWAFFRSPDLSEAHTHMRKKQVSNLLLDAQEMQSSEPRDKIFALQGMLSLMGFALPPPNYSKLVEDVYREAAAAAINHDQSLRIVMGLTGTSNYPNLSSWTPDFSDSNSISQIASWDDHSASRDSQASFHFSADGKVLHTQGTVIDTVVTTYTAFTDSLTLKNTHIFNQQLRNHLSTDVRQEDYIALLGAVCTKHWETASRRYPALRGIIRRLLSLIKEDIVATSLAKGKQSVHNELSRALDRKVLFRTSHTRLGFASQHIQSDDTVVLLSGCRLPMIIRSQGEAWRVVAPAFIHSDSIMEGNLWKDDMELQEFAFA